MKLEEPNNQAVLDTLLGWAATPDNAALEVKAKELVDRHLGDPSLTNSVARLAIIREEVLRLDGLLKFQRQTETEMFAAKRLKEASTGELTHLLKTVCTAINADIAAAREGAGMAKPRFKHKAQVNPAGSKYQRAFASALRSEILKSGTAVAGPNPSIGEPSLHDQNLKGQQEKA